MEYPEYFGEVPEEVSHPLYLSTALCNYLLLTVIWFTVIVFVSIETLQNCPDQLSPSGTGEECVY